MLVPYDYFEFSSRLLRLLQDALNATECCYYESDIMRAFEYGDRTEFDDVINKALQVCINSRVPIEKHFRLILVQHKKGIIREYKLSQFAVYLVTMNADPKYPAVAKAQMFMAQKI